MFYKISKVISHTAYAEPKPRFLMSLDLEHKIWAYVA